MSIKKAVEEALMLKQKGKKLTSILRIVGKDLSAGDKIYTDACVLYNFQRYQDCIKKLFDLKIKFDFIDPQLFSFASNQTFTRQCTKLYDRANLKSKASLINYSQIENQKLTTSIRFENTNYNLKLFN